MIETLIASSVLIGSICLIRFFGKGRIRPLFLYSLWGLAAARLVIPWFYPLESAYWTAYQPVQRYECGRAGKIQGNR